MAENDENAKPERPAGDVPPAEAPVPENRRARRAAASNKRDSRERERERRRAAETGLDAGERVDDAFARFSDRAFRFLKERFNVVQWVIVLGVAGWLGYQIYSWRTDRTAAKVSDELAEALSAELGRVGTPDEEKRDQRGSVDTRRAFATDEDRLKAASEGYKKVADQRPGTPAANLAKLALAGVLYDQGKYDEARKLYEEVSQSELAKLDPESRGRAIEGVGLCLEAKGDKDAALKRFGELENADIPGFRELALYHQGRVLHGKGDDAAAKEKLKKVVEKLGKEPPAGPGEPPSYLLEASKELLQRIDPSAVPASSDDALQKALQEFQKKLPPGIKQVPIPQTP